MWPMKFKPHSRFALPFCIFPMLIAGVYPQFSKTKHPRFLHFSRKSLLRYFGYGVRHSMIKSASIVRNLLNNHTFRTIASILPRFPTNLIRSVYCFQSNMVFQKRAFTNYTIHWFRVEYIISSQIDTFISFTRKIVSSLFDVFSWYIEHYKYFYCTLLQEGRPFSVAYFFYKRKIRIASICTAKELQL